MSLFSKMELYKTRDFSALWNDTFVFFKANFKQLIVIFLVFVLPFNVLISILSKLVFNFLTNNYLEGYEVYNYAQSMDTYNSQIASYFSNYLFGFLKLSWFLFITNCYMTLYNEKEQLTDFKLGDIFEKIQERIFKYIFVTALIFVVILLVLGSIYIIALKLQYLLLTLLVLLLIPPSIAFLGAFYLVYPTYLLEDEDDLILAISKAIKANNRGWGSIFGFLFVLSVILGLFNIFFAIPMIAVNYIFPYLSIDVFDNYLIIIYYINQGLILLAYTFSSIITAVAIYMIYFSFSTDSRFSAIHKLIDDMDTAIENKNNVY